jgi:DNA-binding CsgD family transcriptional regulator
VSERGAAHQFVRGVTDAVSAPAPAGMPEGEEQVVLSAVVGGVRYTLSRCVADPPGEHPELSAREQEIARMVARGYTNKMVAAVLDISCWTVDTYLRRVFTKLGVRSRSAMVTRLTREGILDAADGTPEWHVAWRAHVDRKGDDAHRNDDRGPARAG